MQWQLKPKSYAHEQNNNTILTPKNRLPSNTLVAGLQMLASVGVMLYTYRATSDWQLAQSNLLRAMEHASCDSLGKIEGLTLWDTIASDLLVEACTTTTPDSYRESEIHAATRQVRQPNPWFHRLIGYTNMYWLCAGANECNILVLQAYGTATFKIARSSLACYCDATVGYRASCTYLIWFWSL